MRYPDGGGLTAEERGRRRWSRRGYLQERQPALDYRSLDALAQQRGRTPGLAWRAITAVSTA